MSESLFFEPATAPLVFMRFSGHLDRAIATQMNEAFDQMLGRRKRFALVSDLRRVDGSDAAARGVIAEWIKANQELSRRYHVGTAMLVSGRIVQAALGLIGWVQKPVTPQKIYVDVEGALKYGLDALAMHDVEVPAAHRARVSLLLHHPEQR